MSQKYLQIYNKKCQLSRYRKNNAFLFKTAPTFQNLPKEKEAKEKYVITGVNYMESSTLGEEDRKRMEKELKRNEKKFDRLER